MRLVLSVQQQAGAAQLRLNVQSTALLPRCHKIQNVRMRTNALVVHGFFDASFSLAVTPEALSGALDSVQTPVLVILHLKKTTKTMQKKSGVLQR